MCTGILASTDAEARTVIDHDVVVTSDISWTDDTYEVHGNVTVLGGMTLHMSRVVLEIVGTSDGSHRIEVRSGGHLIADNSTIRGSPSSIGAIFAGNVFMATCTVEGLYVSNVTEAMLISGVAELRQTTIKDTKNHTAIRVTGTLEATDCQFLELGYIALFFPDPSGARKSSLKGCTLNARSMGTGDTYGILMSWTEAVTADVGLDVADCEFQDFSYGLQGFFNTARASLDVLGSSFAGCDQGISVSGNNASVSIVGCELEGPGTAGINIYVIDPLEVSIDLTIADLGISGFDVGINIRGPAHGFRPFLDNVTVILCTQGIHVLGSTVLVEDSNVTECGVCFYVESMARIEIRRTEHTYRSAAFAPGPQAAVVAFSVVNVTTCRWRDGPVIPEGYLILMGDDGVELERLDLAEPQALEVVVWSLTKYNDLGRQWIIPIFRVGNEGFMGANISIYNLSAQHVEIVDNLPPTIDRTWPDGGHWFATPHITVSGRVVDNGSGLASLVARIEGGQEIEAAVDGDGLWSVTFDPVDDGPYTVELLATDDTGGTTAISIADLTVDTSMPTIDIDQGLDVLVNTTWITVTGRTEPYSIVHMWEVDAPPDSPYKCEDETEADGEGYFSLYVCMGAGLHQVSINATDRAGHVATISMTVSMDPNPPAVSITSPLPRAWLNSTTVHVSGVVTDKGTSAWVKGWIDGEELIDAEGDFTADLEYMVGEHTIRIKVMDEAGNRYSASVRFNVDVTVPVIRIMTPKEDRFFTTERKVDLQGEVMEDNLLEVTLNGEPIELLSGIFTAALDIEEGENSYVIEVVDMAGNVARSTITILHDLTPPEYTYETTFPEGLTVDVDGTLYGTYTGTGVPEIGFAFQVSEPSRIVASGGLGQAEGEGMLTIEIEMEEGTNTITFTVQDEAGNAASPVTYRIVLDTTPPDIRVDDPIGEVKTEEKNYRVRGRVEEGSALTIDGEAVTVNSDGTFNIQVDLVVGQNTFHLEATDRVGLTSSTDVTLTRQKEADESPGPGVVFAVVGLIAVATVSRTLRRT